MCIRDRDGTLPRATVVLPFLYFAIYAGLTIAGHRQLFRLRQEIARNNQAVHVAFDPKQNDLVVETKVVGGSTSPLGEVPENLVEAYDIPVVYGDNGNPRIASHLSYRVVAKKTCDAIGRGDPNVVTLAFQENGAFNFNLCLLRQPEDPTKPVLIVAAEETVETEDWVLPTKVSTITLTNANNQSFTLKGGTAAPFTWLPAPVIGCALDSAAPKWRCFAEFERDAYAPLAGKNSHDLDHNANTAAIAAVLELVATPASGRDVYKRQQLIHSSSSLSSSSEATSVSATASSTASAISSSSEMARSTRISGASSGRILPTAPIAASSKGFGE